MQEDPILRNEHEEDRWPDHHCGIEQVEEWASYILVLFRNDFKPVDVSEGEAPAGKQPNNEYEGVNNCETSGEVHDNQVWNKSDPLPKSDNRNPPDGIPILRQKYVPSNVPYKKYGPKERNFPVLCAP